MNSNLGKVKIWNLKKVFIYKTVLLWFLIHSDNIFLFTGKEALPMVHLLSYHTFKDSEIYEDIIFGPDDL